MLDEPITLWLDDLDHRRLVLGLYFLIRAVFMIGQQLYTNHVVKPKIKKSRPRYGQRTNAPAVMGCNGPSNQTNRNRFGSN